MVVLKDNKNERIGQVEIELWLVPEKATTNSGDVFVYMKDGREVACNFISQSDLQLLCDLQLLYEAECIDNGYWDRIDFPVTGGLLKAINKETWNAWMIKHPNGVFYDGDVATFVDITEQVQFVKCCAEPVIYKLLLNELEEYFI